MYTETQRCCTFLYMSHGWTDCLGSVEALLHEITDESLSSSRESVQCSAVIDRCWLFLSVCADLLCLSICFVCLSVCPTILVRLQALEWLHKRGRSYSDLKPDNIRVLMGQQPGTFCHVTLPDMGGSVKFKGESLVLGALWVWGCIWSSAALSCCDHHLFNWIGAMRCICCH